MTDSGQSSGAPDHGRARALGDIAFNAVLAALFALAYWRAGDLPASMWEPLGARSFPRLVLAGLIGMNLIVIGVQLPKLWASTPGPRGAVAGWLWQHRLAFVLLALFLGYVVAIHWIGFAWASLAFLLIGQIALGARSPRALIVAVAVALVFSFGTDALFGRVFNIMLPGGVLLH